MARANDVSIRQSLEVVGDGLRFDAKNVCQPRHTQFVLTDQVFSSRRGSKARSRNRRTAAVSRLVEQTQPACEGHSVLFSLP